MDGCYEDLGNEPTLISSQITSYTIGSHIVKSYTFSEDVNTKLK